MATWRGFDCRLARESGAWSLAWAFQSGDFCYGNLERNKGCMDYSGPPNPRALQYRHVCRLSNADPMNIFRRLRNRFRGHLSTKMLRCGRI